MHDIIDIDTGAIVSGERTIEQMGEAILDLVIRSGQRRRPNQGRDEGAGRFHPLEARSFALWTVETLGPQTFRLDGKVAIVTGGGSGIGQAIALKFAAQGAAIRILDVNESAAATTCRRISDWGATPRLNSCDVTDQAMVDAKCQLLFCEERVHILVNNAGISHIGTVESTTPEDFDK